MTASSTRNPVPAMPPGEPPREMLAGAESHALPRGAHFLRILAVNYVHIRTEDQGDLYVTEEGLPFIEHLRPENWYEQQWFKEHAERLHGTSVVYRVPTRPLPGHPVASLQLVAKWSRVGEDVPLDTFTLTRYMDAEFNSPFEEFSLVQELREGEYGPADIRIYTQKPLAIYVPPERLQMWQTGRSRDRILRKKARHVGIEIDILRSYILLYQWVKGINAVEAYSQTCYEESRRQELLAELTRKVEHDLRAKGFIVADHKPSHFIVRMRGHEIRRRRRTGEIVYALVDHELLARTPDHEEQVKAALRSRYLLLQRDRFNPSHPVVFPPHLKPASVLGVDYVYGRAESTGGILWVVGKDPDLFGYFLPERWRRKQFSLSPSNRTWYTQTKDRVFLVWKVSRVGDLPPGSPLDPRARRLIAHGYNSPFEEFAIALEMMRRGVKAVYPRAIYVTAQPGGSVNGVADTRRFDAARGILSPEGQPVLRPEPDYVTIWGYWRGLEDDQAPEDVGFWSPIDAEQARAKDYISAAQLEEIMERHRATLAAAGFEDLDLRPDHVLLSYRPGAAFMTDEHGRIQTRHCNMEMVRCLRPAPDRPCALVAVAADRTTD